MSKPTFAEAVAAYQSVLGGRDKFPNQNINFMLEVFVGENKGSPTTFRDQVLQLNTMAIAKGDTVLVEKSGKRKNTAKYITSGASGVVYLGASGTIYKKISITVTARLEEEVKEAFLEAWFQTVLSLDKAKGQHIGKITGFFRDSSIVRSGDQGWWQGLKTATFYITMESIPISFNKMLTTASAASGGKAKIVNVKPKLQQLADVLIYLNNTYGFRHRDLHQGNVMFTAAPSMDVKIIDFGRSCINFEWSPGRVKLYSMDKWGADDIPAALVKGANSGCFSLDHFIFLISILQDGAYEAMCSYSLNKMLNELVTGGKENLYYYLRSRSDRHPAGTYSPFWDSYPWSFSSWGDAQILALTKAPCFTLEGFKTFIDKASDAQYPEPARAASANAPVKGAKAAAAAAAAAAGHTGPRGGARKIRTKRRRNVRRKTRRSYF